jgi:gliding motility-associated-like protein
MGYDCPFLFSNFNGCVCRLKYPLTTAMHRKLYPIIFFLVVCCFNAGGQVITSIIGDGTFGTSTDGSYALISWIASPQGVVKYGNKTYFCESAVDKIRFIGANGLLGTAAGTGVAGYSGDGGLAINAQLYDPGPIAIDNTGTIYFVDQSASVVRKISVSGIITTVTGSQGFGYSGDGGPAALAKLGAITDIHVDNAGNLLIVDWWYSVVRKVNMTTGIITTIIGTGTLGFSGDGGPATAANLESLYGVVTDNAGNIYVTDAENKRIRKVNTAGIITTIAGTGATGNGGDGGPATAATFSYPIDLTIDATGNLYVYDTVGVIRKITPAGIISRYAGTGVSGYSGDGGVPLAARIAGPYISIDTDGLMYISDYSHNRIRKIHCPEIILYDQSVVDTSVCLAMGNTAHFYMDVLSATGYQWQVNTGTGWTDITNNTMYAGATTSDLDITGVVGTMNNYQYRCRAYNLCRDLYSEPVTMHVIIPMTPAVVLTASATTICPGTSVTFTANITNTGPGFFLVWMVNGNMVQSGGAWTWATSYLRDGDIVMCEVLTNEFCVTRNYGISNSITMVVNLPGPAITISPSSNNVCPNTSVTFTANVTNPGTSPLYQWSVNGVNVGTNSNTYTNNIWQNGDIVRCTYRSTSACGASELLSNLVTMTVATGTVPTIYVKPEFGCSIASFMVEIGNAITLYAEITNGGSAPVYQWKRNGANIGGNSSSYTGSFTPGDVVTCTVTSNSPCVTTTTATSLPIILDFFGGSGDVILDLAITPSTDMCTNGAPVTFTANSSAPGSSPIYTWRKNGIITGTNSNTFTDNSPVQGDMYTCTLFSNAGCLDTRTISRILTYNCTECDPFTRPINTIINVQTPRCANIGYGGNLYYSTGSNGNQIKMLTPAGTTVTIAGTGAVGNSGDGGPATAAQLNNPRTVVAGNDGTIYFIDQFDRAIRKINPATGIITTIATTGGAGGEGSPLNTARLLNIADITLDNAGNLYIADMQLFCVKKVNVATNITNTVAGQSGLFGATGDGGPATLARLASPSGVAVDNAGNLYISDYVNRNVRKVNTAGIISTYAGKGPTGSTGDGGLAVDASFTNPNDVAVDNAGNVYVADYGIGIRKILSNGIIIRVAGNGSFGSSGDGGPATAAQTISNWVSIDNNENIYITEYTFNTIRKVSCAPVTITQQPVDTLLCNPPGDISFYVRACNASGYQWQVNTGSAWTDVSNNAMYAGVTSSKLNITGAILAMNNYQYRCRVFSSCNTVFSQPSLLRVKAVEVPSVTINTANTTLCQGANGFFNAIPVNGGPAPAYQWKKNGVNVGTNSNTYIDNALVNGDQVSCVLTISSGECVTTTTATSNTITVTMSPVVTPTISITASANNICGGTPISFTLTSTNAGSAPFYQWQKNGVNVAAGTTYTDNTLVTGDVIRCALISNAPCVSGSGLAFSNNVTMTIVTTVTPTISIAASGNNVCAGTNITFTSTITNGGTAPVYQWKKNGVDVGTNNNTYTDNSLSNNDIITCVLGSNSPCAAVPTATSNGITMIINPITPPSITIVASSATICAGIPVTFTSVIVNGGGTPVYQWKKNGVNVGANNNSYTDNVLSNGDIITCALTSSATCVVPATATSNTITMTVNPLLTPTISIAALGNSVCAGTSITFTSAVTNAGTAPVYQWKKNGVNVGANSDSYTDNTFNNGDIITCVLTSNAVCATPATATSNNVTMIIVAAVTPTISIAESANNVCAGTSITFTSVITNGGTAPVYQWKKNGVNVGTNNNTYTDNTLSNNDIITCALGSNSPCAVVPTSTSNGITMIINPVTPPSITIAASSATICAGIPVTFTSIIVNGGGTPVYQWKKNGVNVGTNSNSYTDNALNNGDVITCALTSSAVCAVPATTTSNTITMTVNPLLTPAITITESGNSVCAGTPVTFTSVIANGGGTPVYQWKKNGVNVGTSNNSYTDNTLNNGDIISCVLSSSAGCATAATVNSNSVTMIVNPLLAPTIFITGSGNNICEGAPVTFVANITNGGAVPIYQWKKNGLNVGAGNNIYTDNALANGDIISCILTSNAVCATPATATSNNVTMIVNPVVTPALSIIASSMVICAGAPVTFNSAITNGGTAPIYQWKKNGVNVGTNNNSYTDNTLNNGDVISCVLTSSMACTSINTVNSNNITITVNPVLIPTISIAVSDNTICAGTNVNFTAAITNSGTTPVYQWKRNGIVTGTNTPAYNSAALNDNDIITCELTSSYACAAPALVISNPVQMTVDPVLTPAVVISTADNSICKGLPAIFNAAATDAGALPAYEWRKNGLPVGTSSPSYTDNALNNNDVITCIITANANCLTTPTANSNTIAMTIFNNPVVVLDQTPTLCTGAIRQLDAGAFASYIWNTGQLSRLIDVNNAGTYSVIVTDNNGCNGNGSTTITTMLPQPGGFLPLDTSFCNFGSITLQPGSGYNSYTWSTGARTASITTNQPGTYWLEVTDNNNCKGTSTVLVTMKQCLKGLYTPNAFTPNHDGKNDVFRAQLFGDIKKYELVIFNRWGNVVFRTKDPGKGWDGTFNGTEPTTGVYAWICSYQLEGEAARVEKGTVTLIR